MARATAEMQVIDKMYQLVIWSCEHIAKFPRNFRFTLGERLESRLYDVLDTVLRAKYQRDRMGLLQHANMELELLRFQYRMAKDLKCLSVESYGSAARFVNEVGQLLGGWLKQSSRGDRR